MHLHSSFCLGMNLTMLAAGADGIQKMKRKELQKI